MSSVGIKNHAIVFNLIAKLIKKKGIFSFVFKFSSIK